MSYQREFGKRLNVGVIGIGSHCYRNILPALNYLPVRLKAVCNRDAAVGQETAAQYGCAHYQTPAEMYEREDIDAVFISVSAKLHPQFVITSYSIHYTKLYECELQLGALASVQNGVDPPFSIAFAGKLIHQQLRAGQNIGRRRQDDHEFIANREHFFCCG